MKKQIALRVGLTLIAPFAMTITYVISSQGYFRGLWNAWVEIWTLTKVDFI